MIKKSSVKRNSSRKATKKPAYRAATKSVDAPQPGIQKDAEPSRIIVSTSQLADLFRVTSKTVAEWSKLGMPKSAYGNYDLSSALAWWLEHVAKGSGSKTEQKARERYWVAKAEEYEIKVSQIKGDLISKGEVLDEWCKRIGEVRQSLLGLPVALPPILEGKDPRTMRDMIRVETVKILNGYCRPGKHCPPEPKARKK